MGGRKGFTLVELLVVMAIISLIAGLVVPAVRKAQERAKQAVCMSNLRQLGQAFLTYASDHEGYLPAWFAVTGKYPRDRVVTYDGGKLSCWHGILIRAGYLKNAEVLLCPSDVPSAKWRGCVIGDNTPKGISYAVMAHSTSAEAGYDRETYNPIGSPDDVRLILAWDAERCQSYDPCSGIGYAWNPPGTPNGYDPAICPTPRHLGTINILWLDGHVNSMTQELAMGSGPVEQWFHKLRCSPGTGPSY